MSVNISIYRLALTYSMVPAITISTPVSGGCAVPTAAANWSCKHDAASHGPAAASQSKQRNQ